MPQINQWDYFTSPTPSGFVGIVYRQPAVFSWTSNGTASKYVVGNSNATSSVPGRFSQAFFRIGAATSALSTSIYKVRSGGIFYATQWLNVTGSLNQTWSATEGPFSFSESPSSYNAPATPSALPLNSTSTTGMLAFRRMRGITSGATFAARMFSFRTGALPLMYSMRLEQRNIAFGATRRQSQFPRLVGGTGIYTWSGAAWTTVASAATNSSNFVSIAQWWAKSGPYLVWTVVDIKSFATDHFDLEFAWVTATSPTGALGRNRSPLSQSNADYTSGEYIVWEAT